MARAIIIVLLALVGLSCSNKYAKMAKKGTIAEKDSAAVFYFNKKAYESAMPLFEELLGIYRGSPRYQKILYFYSYCKYGLGDYITAAFYFEEFAKQFPNSDFTEEAQFMIPMSYYAMSAAFPLDQSETNRAIEGYHVFLQQYPMSGRKDLAEGYIKELEEKLMKKAFEQANLYFKIGYFKSAVIAFRNFISDFPNSPNREEAAYKIILSYYEYAKVSVETKQKERYQIAIDYYYKFIDRYPGSKYLKDAEECFSLAQKNLEKLKKN